VGEALTGHALTSHALTGHALTGEVLRYDGKRWRVVHLGDQVAVDDRRRVTYDRPPTFTPKTDTAAEGDRK
jgi:hypothetical protein